MKTHYFQRFRKKEDAVTANTILLLTRLQAYSPSLFSQFLKEQFFEDVDFNPELSFVLQDRGEKSIPDATITQQSFKLVIETKLMDSFYENQLIRHLDKFGNEEYKVLITLSPELMDLSKKQMIDKSINQYNKKNKTNIIHVNTKFEYLIRGIQDVLTERDYEMQDVLDDFRDYCYHDKLMDGEDAKNIMRMKLAGQTFDFNISQNVYYDSIKHGFRKHKYLCLYKQKSIRAIGKIEAIITAINEGGELVYVEEKGKLTKERKQIITKAREEAKGRGWILNAERYFFVERFYETDFQKVTKGAPMGTRVFDLTEVLGIEKLPDIETIAELLRERKWS